MSDQEIITARVQTALDRGWQPRSWDDGKGNVYTEEIAAFDVYKYGLHKVTFFTDDATRFYIPVWQIIFNHDFAKSLWGIEGVNRDGIFIEEDALNPNLPADYICKYQYHLKQMVLADDPIKYLEENI